MGARVFTLPNGQVTLLCSVSLRSDKFRPRCPCYNKGPVTFFEKNEYHTSSNVLCYASRRGAKNNVTKNQLKHAPVYLPADFCVSVDIPSALLAESRWSEPLWSTTYWPHELDRRLHHLLIDIARKWMDKWIHDWSNKQIQFIIPFNIVTRRAKIRLKLGHTRVYSRGGHRPPGGAAPAHTLIHARIHSTNTVQHTVCAKTKRNRVEDEGRRHARWSPSFMNCTDTYKYLLCKCYNGDRFPPKGYSLLTETSCPWTRTPWWWDRVITWRWLMCVPTGRVNVGSQLPLWPT